MSLTGKDSRTYDEDNIFDVPGEHGHLLGLTSRILSEQVLTITNKKEEDNL